MDSKEMERERAVSESCPSSKELDTIGEFQ